MFAPEKHILIDAQWHKNHAQRFIRTLFNDAEAIFRHHHFWPCHPAEDPPPDRGYVPWLYDGLAGISWAQIELSERGYGELQNDYLAPLKTARIAAVDDLKNTTRFDNPGDYLAGLLIGEVGFSAPILRLGPDPKEAGRAIELISTNLRNEVLELLWGSPGSMLLLAGLIESGSVAKHHSQLLLKGVDYLQEQLIESPTHACRLWRQNLYNERKSYLGAAHGFAGNSLAIIRSFDYLDSAEQNFWTTLIRQTAIHTAITQSGEANWAVCIDSDDANETSLLQFCHGAPGMIISLSGLMGEDAEFDALMLAAGALVFRAGPLAKGSNFCHGTSGNGWALLKLFETTQDEMWLDRAKQFAAAAIKQSENGKADHACFHHSLWTGDQGVALLADACISHQFEVPTLELF